ncbi:hypothetical protein GJAV_G00036380 [Gymnothorax javanicus]|nr:hypothetical protein GJAV_G00036380 [Gymnothorax javanicus]
MCSGLPGWFGRTQILNQISPLTKPLVRAALCVDCDLKRKLNILTRPSGLNVEDSKLDGPLLQILFGNNDISKQFRQEVEDCIHVLVQKHVQELQQRKDSEKFSFHVKPQPSSFILEENQKEKISDPIRKIKDAFSVVGSVLYFTSFCLDRLGQPLLNENPQLTEGWEVPKYQQVFCQVVAAEGLDVQMKDKSRPKPCCFNCGAEDHQLRDCPKPKDMARISEKRKEFSGGNTPSNQRYHAEEVEERFGKYKPGVVSDELMEALGVTDRTLPPFIYRMRQLGYPPGWLKEAELESSGLTLYHGKVSSDGEIPEDDGYQANTISYDVSKLVNFPGFNVSAPANVIDDWRLFGSVPMQPEHMKKNFAAYLSAQYPMPGASCNKRGHEPESSPRQTKKRRSDVDGSRCSDMEVDSGSDTPRSSRNTPPSTPANGSPALRAGRGCEEVGDEDGLTLEELEEQQRLLWAALENADTATNSDSETPAAGTPLLGSSGASTPALAEAEEEEQAERSECTAEEEQAERSECIGGEVQTERSECTAGEVEAAGSEASVQVSAPNGISCTATAQDSPAANRELETKEDVEDGAVVGDARAAEEVHATGELVDKPEVPQDPENASAPGAGSDSVETPTGEAMKVDAVPHRSKFAAGIIPFEDTPEYKDVAEATGVYLRIRDLLKFSPRNLAKNKK